MPLKMVVASLTRTTSTVALIWPGQKPTRSGPTTATEQTLFASSIPALAQNTITTLHREGPGKAIPLHTEKFKSAVEEVAAPSVASQAAALAPEALLAPELLHAEIVFFPTVFGPSAQTLSVSPYLAFKAQNAIPLPLESALRIVVAPTALLACLSKTTSQLRATLTMASSAPLLLLVASRVTMFQERILSNENNQLTNGLYRRF